jgi:secondary thiamine-phosphate synthase enzyme
MRAIEAHPICRHTTLFVETRQPTDFIDITSHLDAFVASSGIVFGVLNVQSLHTTAALGVNEHEPLLLDDMAALLTRLAPPDAVYRHDETHAAAAQSGHERPNGHSHCRAMLLAPSVTLNVAGGLVQLGRWQRVFLIELDGPRARELSLLAFGCAG